VPDGVPRLTNQGWCAHKQDVLARTLKIDFQSPRNFIRLSIRFDSEFFLSLTFPSCHRYRSFPFLPSLIKIVSLNSISPFIETLISRRDSNRTEVVIKAILEFPGEFSASSFLALFFGHLQMPYELPFPEFLGFWTLTLKTGSLTVSSSKCTVQSPLSRC
jgi:hypothetical protein